MANAERKANIRKLTFWTPTELYVFRTMFNHLQSFFCFELLIPLCATLLWVVVCPEHARTQRGHEVNAVHTTATWGLDEASANLLWSPLRPVCLLISFRGVLTNSAKLREVNWTERLTPYSVPLTVIHRPWRLRVCVLESQFFHFTCIHSIICPITQGLYVRENIHCRLFHNVLQSHRHAGWVFSPKHIMQQCWTLS